MSNIEINATNIKKFSKRLQKQTKEKGISLSLAESHELLAKILGCNNYDQLLKSIRVERTLPIKIDSSTIEKSKTLTFEEVNSKIRDIIVNLHTLQARKQLKENDPLIFDGFNECLRNILNVSKSGISLCYFQKNGNYDYSLRFETIFEDLLEISTDDIFDDIRSRPSIKMNKSGFSKLDATLMHNIETCDLFPFSKNKFEFKKFLTAFSDFLNKKYGEKTRHIFKITIADESNNKNKIVKIDNKYYVRHTVYLEDQELQRVKSNSEIFKQEGNVEDNSYRKVEFNYKIYSEKRKSIDNKFEVFENIETPEIILYKGY